MPAEVPESRPFSEAYPDVDPDRIAKLLEDNTFVAYTQVLEAKALFEAAGDLQAILLPPGVERGISQFLKAFPKTVLAFQMKLVNSVEFWLFREMEAALAVFNGEVTME